MDYKIVFLGGGPAGYEGAISAGKKGIKTAVIEMDKPGGTCLQRGCVPTKSLLHSIKLIKAVKNGSKSGVTCDNLTVDIKKLAKSKDRVVSKLTKGIDFLFKNYGVDFYNLKGKIISPNEIELSDGRVITSENIVITTGSAPADLPFLKRDGKYIVNSDDALEVTDVPGKLLVIGAGAIGLEMGVIYKYLGSDVTVVEIMPHIVPGSDFECADILHKELNKQKVKVLCSCSASDPVINEEEHKVSMKFKTDDKEWEDSFDKVLVAVGRKPYSEGAFSDNLGIKLDEKGFIKVDSNLMTDVKNIYACGDVTAGQLLAHRASHQATAIVEHILNSTPVHQNAVPWAVFTFPEFAGIGISEEEAKESGITYKVGKFPYSAGSRSNAIDEKAGIVKVITDENGVIIGAHIIGAEAGELLPVLIYAVIKGVKTEEFKELIFIHPTLSENIWEAVGEAGGFSIHI